MEMERVANTADALHCLQASFIMLWASLTGERLSMEDAEKFSGFAPGVETWPYGMIAWLAEHGCEVRHIDALDAKGFADDPKTELERVGTPAGTIEYFEKISDFGAEKERIERGIATGNVVYEARIPGISDVRDGLNEGWFPVLVLDYGTLKGRHKSEFEGHVMIVSGADSSGITVQDPGPPSHWDWTVSDDLLVAALRYPAETSGTVTLVRVK
jgi:hypothetical protein